MTNGWTWVDGTIVPTVQNSGYSAKITVDDSNYDYTGVDGYDSTEHTVTRTIAITVSKSLAPTITAPTATPITYGATLSTSTLSDNAWTWVDGTIVPTVQNSGYKVQITVDDSNYDYVGVDGYQGNGIVEKTIQITVTKATPPA